MAELTQDDVKRILEIIDSMRDADESLVEQDQPLVLIAPAA